MTELAPCGFQRWEHHEKLLGEGRFEGDGGGGGGGGFKVGAGQDPGGGERRGYGIMLLYHLTVANTRLFDIPTKPIAGSDFWSLLQLSLATSSCLLSIQVLLSTPCYSADADVATHARQHNRKL